MTLTKQLFVNHVAKIENFGDEKLENDKALTDKLLQEWVAILK